MDNLCRTCAKYSDNVQASVFLESRFELKFADMIKECTSVNISAMDQLPKIICIDCQLKLELSYAFKIQSLQSQLKLIEILKADVIPNQRHENIETIEVKPLDIKPEQIDIFEDNYAGDEEESPQKRPKPNPYDCNRCCKPCNNQKTLLKHQKTHKDDLTPVTCYLCSKGFQHKQSLNRHMKTHPPEDRIEIFKSSKLNDDKDTDLNSSSTNRFEDSDLNNSNVFEADETETGADLPHANDSAPFPCYICGKGFQHKRSLNRHIKAHLPVDRMEIIKSSKLNDDKDTDLDCSSENPLEDSDYFKNSNVFEEDESNLPDNLSGNQTTLIKHKKTHASDSTPFPCYMCGKGFQHKRSLNRHIKTHPPEDINIIKPCEDTDFDCSSRNAFEDSENDNSNLCDVKTHHESKRSALKEQSTKATNREFKLESEGSNKDSDKMPSDYLNRVELLENKDSTPTKDDTNKPQYYACKVCDKSYTSKVSLSSHNRKHRPPPKPKKIEFKCFKCPAIFISLNLIDEHLKLVHNQERIWCEQCNGFYDSKILLEKHVLKVHQLTCKRCLLKCESVDEFTEHLATHRNDPMPFKCRFCGKGILRPFYIIEHTRIHTGEKPHICQWCGKSFTSYTNLVPHMRMHTDERPYSCKICPARFRQYNSLRAHARCHDTLRPWSCEKCGKTYRHKSDLRHHIKKHLGLIKKSPCPICGKVLARQQMLIHMEYHSGIKKHVCDVCQKAFVRPYALKIHMRTHTGEKPFSCEVCPKQFSQKHVLAAHMNTHQS